MLDKKTLFQQFGKADRIIHVEAWDADVKIRDFSVEERKKIISEMIKSPISKDGDTQINYADALEAKLLAVSMALVEPKLTVNDLRQLSEKAMDGINEIYDAIEGKDEESEKKD